MAYLNTVITGTGSYIPTELKTNSDFAGSEFYDEQGKKFDASFDVIVDKFKAITGIEERRYASLDMKTSDLATIAAQRAIESANIDPESIDQIIMAQNFGDMDGKSIQASMVPSLSARVKHNLGIANPSCVAYDILFGCPGWIQGVLQADAYIKAGIAKRVLVIGGETLSRVTDKHDRDTMIFSDGAGACIIEGLEEDNKRGLLASAMRTDTKNEAHFLYFGKSYKPGSDENVHYIKMLGRKIYEYALNHVPMAMKDAMDKSGVDIQDVKKFFIHQANEKMDEAIIKRLYKLFKIRELPKNIMPMSINTLGNSSVATVPTLYDRVLNNKYENHSVTKDDILLFASVGAGMHINAFVYKQ